MSEQPSKNLEVDTSLQSLENLKDFEFNQVLGSLTDSKIENKPGVLLLNKVAFSEDSESLQLLISSAQIRHLSDNDIYGNFEMFPEKRFCGLKTTLIYPATPKHIDKYKLRPAHFILESADDYQNLTLPYFLKSSFSCEWVYNILDGKKEQDMLVYKDQHPETGFMLLRDLKWDGKTLEEMYYQAIVLRRDLKDLTDKELPLLENILESSNEVIERTHGIPGSKLVAFFHYQPSYYHLHVHFRSTRSQTSTTNIPIGEVIENLKIWPDFYQRAALGFTVKEGDPLHDLYVKAGRL